MHLYVHGPLRYFSLAHLSEVVGGRTFYRRLASMPDLEEEERFQLFIFHHKNKHSYYGPQSHDYE